MTKQGGVIFKSKHQVVEAIIMPKVVFESPTHLYSTMICSLQSYMPRTTAKLHSTSMTTKILWIPIKSADTGVFSIGISDYT